MSQSERALPMSSNLIGVLWMLVAVTSLTSMFAIAKYLMQSLPLVEVGMFRFVMSLLFYLPWLAQRGVGALKTSRPGAHFSRGFFGAGSLLASIYAVQHMRLADATVLAFSIPLWSVLFAALFLRERIRLGRTLATFAGFIGVVVMVRPQAGFEPAAAIALLSAILATSSITTMKSLTRTEPTERIVFYFLLSGAVMMGVPTLYAFELPSLIEWAWLFALGLVGWFGQYCMTRAYAAGDMTVIAPFDFTRVIIAGILGYVVFGEVPDTWGLVGAGIVMCACAYIAGSEARRSETPS